MAFTPELQRAALRDADTQVRAAAVRIATRDLAPELIAMTREKDTIVRAISPSSCQPSACRRRMRHWRSCSSPAAASKP